MTELTNIGAQMANVMFNLTQRPGEPLTSNDVATMDKLRKEWDAARRATPSSDCTLPPLPRRSGQIVSHEYGRSRFVDAYTTEQVEQIRREAVEADRRARGMVPSSMRVPEQPASAAQGVKTWQERCDWASDEPATKLIVEAMKAEIAELRDRLARQSQEPQADVLAIHDEALEVAALLCETIASDKYDQYKGRGKHAPNNPQRADTYTSGESDGADLCADKIRELKSTAAAPAHPVAQPALRGSDAQAQAMDEVAQEYAHSLALNLECIIADDYSGKWYGPALEVVSKYRQAMAEIHERESPTWMGEPFFSKDQPHWIRNAKPPSVGQSSAQDSAAGETE